MGIRSSLSTKAAGAAAAAAAPVAAPLLSRQLLERGIGGFPGFPGAREVAAKHLARHGDPAEAVKGLIEQHVRLAGAQGFVSNLGGLPLLALTLPANVTGLALLHVRLAAAIAHLRGHDLDDPRVHAAVLMAVLGESGVEEAVQQGLLPNGPFELLQGTGAPSEGLLDKVSRIVMVNLTQWVTGKRAALVLARRVPLLGGGVGGAMDAYSIYAAGRYADREFPPAVSVRLEQVAPNT
jgi:hypothetical protein